MPPVPPPLPAVPVPLKRPELEPDADPAALFAVTPAFANGAVMGSAGLAAAAPDDAPSGMVGLLGPFDKACGVMSAAATAALPKATPATALRSPPEWPACDCTLAPRCAMRKMVRRKSAAPATRKPASASFDSETTANSRFNAWRARHSKVSIVPISTPS